MSNRDDFLDGLLGPKRNAKRESQPTVPQESESDADALLGGLLGTKQRQPAAKTDEPKGAAGLTPLDLLTLPAAQRKLVNWLSRKKQATFAEIQEALGQGQSEVEKLIGDLKAAEYIHEALADGAIQYRVVFRGAVRRGPVGLPGEIWARVDLDHMTFLKQLSLFRGLSDAQIKEVAGKLQERRYQRDEVILWQGNVSEYVYFIKSGIVGIARFSAQNKERKALAYLKQGDIFGEYSILPEQGGVSSATATALSTVDTVMLSRADFFDLLNQHSSVAIELARILVQRLIATDSHFSSAMGTRLALVIGVGQQVGMTTIGNMMAMTLAQATQKSTVYTEQPDSHRLAGVFGVSANLEMHKHAGGYDLMISTGYSGLPSSVRATLVYEQLVTQYDNIVIGVPSWAEEIMNYLIGYADQITVVCAPEPDALERLEKLSGALKSLVHPEKVGLFYVMNRTKPEHADRPAQRRVDFDLPYVAAMEPVAAQRAGALPQAFEDLVSALADRLGRTNQVSVYIPTTIDVSQPIDTSAYVERTLAFLGERFGGATTNQARGVWSSTDAGLVGEDIHIVRSYATQPDVDKYLPEILDYVETLKQELRQEAMALEINHKLLLI